MFYATTPNRRKHWYRLLSIGQKKVLLLIGLVVLLGVAFLSALLFYTVRAWKFDIDAVVHAPGSSMLYDADNRPIAALSGNMSLPLQWEELPQDLINAFVAREDAEFFSHNGVVISGVARSLLRNLTSLSYEQGASTITMQLARNVYDMHEKTMDRKLLEAVLAQRIEHHYDKQTIFLQYLNRIYFGQSCDGIRAAAERYFGKKVKDLNLVECATLAGLVRGPSIYNPERNMKQAVRVKNETLDRMQECGFISEGQCAEAKAAPIELHRSTEADAGSSSYATMWAHDELEELNADLDEESAGGVSVVSNLNLPIQQLLERATEQALAAVEQPALYPEAWNALYPDEKTAEEAKKAFMKMRRPRGMKIRGEDNDLTNLLQACVLVVDTRRNKLGNVLAVVAGRSAADGINRWKQPCQPGRNAAPLLFTCACMPGEDEHHIVARDTVQTGRTLGYDSVYAFYDSLKLEGCALPDREHADDLYAGQFPMRRIDLARLLFDLQYQGKGYRLGLIRSIWNSHRVAIYAYEPAKAPEYIRRESAVAAAGLPPFICTEGEPILLSEPMADHGGQWVMLNRPKAACVFVWMGADDAASPTAQAPELRPLLAKAALNLAREVLSGTRAILREQMAQQAAAEKAKTQPQK